MTAAPAYPPRLEKDAVLAELRVSDVIAHFQLQGKERAGELRVGVCPVCGVRSRKDAVCINLSSGRWHCKAQQCSGDILDLVAGYAGLDIKREFQRVLELGGAIAGVGPGADPAALERSRKKRQAEEQARKEAKARKEAAAIVRSRQIWGELSRRSLRGETYLRDQRGLDVEQLVDRNLVRFGQQGDPFVALWSSAGEVKNVVRRYIDPGVECPSCDMRNIGNTRCWKCQHDLAGADTASKCAGQLSAPSLGTLVGRLCDLTRGQLVVITEGVMDTLTACLAWPDALVLGAHGAGELPHVATTARAVARAGGDLNFVPHNDPIEKDGRPGPGTRFGDEAMAIALEAGLVSVDAKGEPVTRVRSIVVPAKDLNDAYRAGWRP